MDEKHGEKTGNWDPDEPERRAVIEKSQMASSFSYHWVHPTTNREVLYMNDIVVIQLGWTARRAGVSGILWDPLAG